MSHNGMDYVNSEQGWFSLKAKLGQNPDNSHIHLSILI